MTREEAIDILREYRWIGRLELTEAIGIAMSALSAERHTEELEEAFGGKIKFRVPPTEPSDLISRADVFEIIDKAFSQPMKNGVALYADICLMLNALPTHANSRSTHERDLISRADAIKAIKGHDERTKTDTLDDSDIGYSAGLDMAIEIINKMPSVSVESKATENKYDCDLISERKEAKSTLLTLKHLFEDEQILKALDVAIECVSADRVGEWEYDVDADDSFCTNCHKYAIRDMEMQLESDFCPNCGARMENTK